MTEPTAGQREVITILENLIRVAKRNDITIAGFAFSAEHLMFINFGNCSDMGDLRLYETLLEFRNKQIEKGNAPQQQKVDEVN